MPLAIWGQFYFPNALRVHIISYELNFLTFVDLDVFCKTGQVSESHLPRSNYEILERLKLSILSWTPEKHILDWQYVQVSLIVLLIAELGPKQLLLNVLEAVLWLHDLSQV